MHVLHFFQSALDLFIRHAEGQCPVVDVDDDLVAFLYRADGAAGGCFRRNVRP